MAKWHVKDGSEFENAEGEIVIEEEGYLHGKKVLEDLDEEGGSSETKDPDSPSRIPRPMAAGVCPFSGIARGMDDLTVSEESANSQNGIETNQE